MPPQTSPAPDLAYTVEGADPSSLRERARVWLRPLWRLSRIGGLRKRMRYERMRAEWEQLRKVAPVGSPLRAPDEGTLFIVACDPYLLIASKGDEAMIRNTINAARARIPSRRIVISTATKVADDRAAELGIESLRLHYEKPLANSLDRIMATSPSQILAIGADVMDGAYDPAFSFQNFALIDLAAARGIPAYVTGFSVSKRPYKELGKDYEKAVPGLVFKLRDPDSFDRFNEWSSAPSQLVADPAFLMKPDYDAESVRPYLEWIGQRTGGGRSVVGFNIHPVLFKKEKADLPKILEIIAAELRAVMEDLDIDLVLVAHDFRGDAGDVNCLDPLFSQLSGFPDRVLNLSEELPANQLKAVAGSLTAVVAGRMHLSIASLGAGTPVLGLSYMDKFSGLFKHFGMGQGFFLEPSELVQPGRLRVAIEKFVANQKENKRIVEAALPSVVAMSQLNYSFLHAA